VAYLSLLLFVSVIYIRPGELVAAWALVPFVELSALIAVFMVVITYLREPRPWVRVPHDGFLIGFWLAIVASNLAWGWLGGAVKGFVEFFRIVFFYFLMRFAVRTPRHLHGLLILLVGLALFQSASGIVQYATGFGFGNVEILPTGRIRGSGIFNDPNDLAQALLMVVPFLLVAIAGPGMALAVRTSALLAVGPILVALALTSSRGAGLGLGVLAIAFTVWRLGRVAGLAIAVVVVTAVAVSGPRQVFEVSPTEDAGDFQFGPAMTQTTSGNDPASWRDTSSTDRVEAWSEGLTFLKSRPLFGIGYSRFLEFHDVVAHNSFIHTFAELGLVGAFFGMGLVYWFFKGLATPPVGPRRAYALALSGMAILVTTSFLSRQYDFVLYTLLGLGACHTAVTMDPDHRPTTTRRDLVYILLLTLGGVVATKLAVTVLTAWIRG
jgi:O-antigen ligase